MKSHCSKLWFIKSILTVLLILIGISFTHAQLTINVTSVPEETPPDDDLYIAGTFNAWHPGSAPYKLTNNNDGTYSVTFSPPVGIIEYKFTRGNWETVEGTSTGGFLPNRTYNYPGGQGYINVTIAGWAGITGDEHTAEDNVQVMDEDFYIPQLNRNRRIWLYLPPDYNTSTKKYPVIYLQDGQNLFDAYYSFAGEWKIDESMNDLFDQGDYGAIVVGIDNGGSERINEYSSWVNPGYGGGKGEAYAAFLVNTLKPYIDGHYRTLPGREYTAIGGSSMGANISMYTAIEYQEVFGKVGIFSPAFWFSDSSYIHLESKGITNDLRIYFVAGVNESGGMIPDMMAMYDALADAGQDENQMYFLSEADGAHSEWFWAREYPDTYEWLFDELILSTSTPTNHLFTVYPNPLQNYLSVSTELKDLKFAIYSTIGNVVLSGSLVEGSIDTSGLTQGLYFLEIKDKSSETVYVSRILKQ